MKKNLLLFFTILSLVKPCLGQITNTNELDKNKDGEFQNIGKQEQELVDSSEIQVEFIFRNFFYADKIINIIKRKDEDWDYHIGYHSYDEPGIKFQDSIKKEIDWDYFLIQLDSIITQELPTQDKIVLKWNKRKRRKVKWSNEHFFSRVFDGVEYEFLYRYKGKKGKLKYNNPEAYQEILIDFNLSTKEHDIFVKFIHYVIREFEVEKLFRIQILERHGK